MTNNLGAHLGPINLLAKLRQDSGQKLETAEEIELFIETFMDQELRPFSQWVMLLVVWFAILVASPPAVGAILGAV